MPPTQHAVKESSELSSTPDAEAIRTQLIRLLEHPLFTNSKRYPVLLAYTVEQTLLGKATELKERTIGVEAFGRTPDYDVNLDPVVRTSAAEVRRRLAQYYYDPTHANELIIELSAGSYVPSFREPEPPAAYTQSGSHELPANVLEIPASVEPSPVLPKHKSHWMLTAIALLAFLAIGIGIGRYHRPPALSNMQRFWAPMTASQNPVTYCLAEPSDLMGRNGKIANDMPVVGKLAPSDVVTLAHVIVPLVPRHNSFRVISAANAIFAQLREGPDVFIGAFDNAWTMRITRNLPFGFEISDGAQKLVDHKDPRRFWALQWQTPYQKVATDYAIVARIHDTVTGEPVMIAAGLMGQGTEAASEVLYNPTYLDAMLAKAPKDWGQKNLEAVIRTQVIDGNPGPPEILEVASW